MTIEPTLLPDLRDDDDIEAYVSALPADAVAPALARIMVVAKAVRQFQKMLESRMLSEATVGEIFAAADGSEWAWIGDRKRVVQDVDVALLRDALQVLEPKMSTLAKNAFRQAFKDRSPQVYLIKLDELVRWGPPEVKKIVSEYVQWEDGNPHLRLRDESR